MNDVLVEAIVCKLAGHMICPNCMKCADCTPRMHEHLDHSFRCNAQFREHLDTDGYWDWASKNRMRRPWWYAT